MREPAAAARGGTTALVAGFVTIAVAASALLVVRDSLALLVASAVILLVVSLLDWRIPAVAGAAFIPTSVSLATAVGFVGLSDVLLLAALAGALIRGDLFAALRVRSVQVVVGGLLLYLVVALGLGLWVGAEGVVLETAVRTMFWIPPVLVGAAIGVRGGMPGARMLLTAFLIGCIVIAATWLASPFSGTVFFTHKNGAGQSLAFALLVLASPARPRWRALTVTAAIVCAAGLVATGSRGAILSLAIGFVALGLLAALRGWRPGRLLAVLAMIVAGIAALTLLAETILSQVRIFSADYTVQVRLTFWADAIAQTAGREWTGNGIGTYTQFAPMLQAVMTNDPHNVYVLTYFEGGYLLIAAFGAAMLVMLAVLVRAHAVGRLVPLAIALQVILLAHAVVDVYWSRGSLAVPFLVVGLAVAAIDRGPRDPGVGSGVGAGAGAGTGVGATAGAESRPVAADRAPVRV